MYRWNSCARQAANVLDGARNSKFILVLLVLLVFVLLRLSCFSESSFMRVPMEVVMSKVS